MLNENDIRNKLTEYLEATGFSILQSLNTTSKGVDVIAENIKTKQRLFVEVKGETSSKEHTSRFGKSFDGKQVRNHIARAIFAAMKVLSDKPAGNMTKAAIALPANDAHRKELETVKSVVQQLGIKIFWVDKDMVTEE